MGRAVRAEVLALVVVLLIAAGIGGLLLTRGSDPGPPTEPAPPSLVGAPARGDLLTSDPDAPVPSPTGLSTVVAAALANPALGGQLAATVLDVQTGQVLLDSRGSAQVVPASTAKIATAVAALSALDPTKRLETTVVAGAVPGQVVLVGGGDATLVGSRPQPGFPQRATLADLAQQVTTALAGTPVTSVLVDTSLYSGDPMGPEWSPGYVTGGDVAPVSPVLVDQARTSTVDGPRDPQPALAAGRAFAAALGAPTATVAAGRATTGATSLGTVRSPTVAELVEVMLTRSDNDVAESLARQVALARHQPASFAGGAAAVDAVLGEVLPGASFGLLDGSGLSRGDRVEPMAVARLLALVAQDEGGRFGPVLTGLPIAGFDGTLARRFVTGAPVSAAGQVRGKTGTLNGVSALAGLVRTADGRLLSFDLTADAVPLTGTLAAQAALDALAAQIAGCGCR